MRFKLTIALILLNLVSCSFFRHGVIEKNEDIKIDLEDKIMKNSVILSIYRNGDYELKTSLSKIIKYIYFYNDADLIRFCKNVDYLFPTIDSISKTIYCFNSDISEIKLFNREYSVRLYDFLTSGDYYIYDLKNKNYIKEIRIIYKYWDAGPLAASTEYRVWIGDYLFWEYLIDS